MSKLTKLKRVKNELFKLENVKWVTISEESFKSSLTGKRHHSCRFCIDSECESIKDYHDTLKRIHSKLNVVVEIHTLLKTLYGYKLYLEGEDNGIEVTISFDFTSDKRKQIFNTLFKCKIKEHFQLSSPPFMFSALSCETE